MGGEGENCRKGVCEGEREKERERERERERKRKKRSYLPMAVGLDKGT